MSLPAADVLPDQDDNLLDLALSVLPYRVAVETQRRLLADMEHYRRTGDSAPFERSALQAIASASLLQDPSFLRTMEDVRANPPDWSTPGMTVAEWRDRAEREAAGR